MTELILCPECGYELDPRGLGSHKDSSRCLARQDKQKLLDEGYREVPSKKLSNYLEDKGYEIKIGPIAYNRSNYFYFRNRIEYGDYAKKKAIDKYKFSVLSGTYHTKWDKMKETEECIAIKKRTNYYDKIEKILNVFKKDNKGMTRKRVFYTNNGYVYDTSKEKLGKIIKYNSSDIDMNTLEVRLRLKYS